LSKSTISGTVPGVSEVATIGGFVKQYQGKLDPNSFAHLLGTDVLKNPSVEGYECSLGR
jgi:hypothetical protein